MYLILVKAIPIKCFVSHHPTAPAFFFGKVKKISESLVKKQVLYFTSTRSCLISINCLKLSSILRFCSLFRHLVVLFLLYHVITNERTLYLAARPSLILSSCPFPTHLHEREGDGKRNILLGWPKYFIRS